MPDYTQEKQFPNEKTNWNDTNIKCPEKMNANYVVEFIFDN